MTICHPHTLHKDKSKMPRDSFTSLPFSASQTVSWIHIGDPHMTRRGQQNEIDLGKIVDEINAVYAKGGVDFVFIPGDIADDGSVVAYEAFRQHLDRLQLPWFGIVGDHDVHEKSFQNFSEYIAPDLYSAFTIGPYRFLRLNAFSIPKPDSFVVGGKQLQWLEAELQQCESQSQKALLFLHCYPSDLKHGGNELTELLHRYPVLLLEMGHTHYNEISNDGHVLYTATRSTGQIEEGPVGYSITTVAQSCVSWHFVSLGSPSLVAITHPMDERLLTTRTTCAFDRSALPIHAKIWPLNRIRKVHAQISEKFAALETQDGVLWEGELDATLVGDGAQELQVVATDESGLECRGSIRILLGEAPKRTFKPIDQDNAIGEWKERGLLGTQLGPNKNGKKW
jgi:Icc protein